MKYVPVSLIGPSHYFDDVSGASALQGTMLVGIGSSEESYNDAAVAIAFGTFKGQEDHMKELLGDDYYVDALKVVKLPEWHLMLHYLSFITFSPQAIADSADMKKFVDEAGAAEKEAGVQQKMQAEFAKGD